MTEIHMTKEVLKPIVNAWGGAYKFSLLIGVRERTVRRWLAEGIKTESAAKFVNTLSFARENNMEPTEKPKRPFRPDTTRVIKPRSLEEVDAIKEKEL